MDRTYRVLTALISPLLPLWLRLRRLRGKEDVTRWRERFGHAGAARPEGMLLWLHAASVGEANSVLMLIEKLREIYPHLYILLTTGTVTSARLMEKRLPAGAIHQYVPVDTPAATQRFMYHWRPEFAFWVESEFWPNLVAAADDMECFMGVINARMSERSFRFWRKYPGLIESMLGRFDCLFAQSEEDAARLKSLGAKDPLCLGNLKYDAALLPCDETELLAMRNLLGKRPVWLAASTHAGEEKPAAKTHALLAATRPDLLTVIVPRHPGRGEDIAEKLGREHRVALRSRKDAIAPDTQIYIADTLGELGLFYRLSEIVFMGGSLVRRGGQNPLEPARLACAIVTGPHTHNFAGIYRDMERAGACARVNGAQNLAAQIDRLLITPAAKSAMQANARKWVENRSGAVGRLLDLLAPILAPGKRAA